MMNYAIVALYTVKDTKAESCVAPFAFRNDAEAIRAFGDSVSKGDTPLSTHAEDFFLYRVGTFNQVSGQILSEEHKCLASALDFKEAK